MATYLPGFDLLLRVHVLDFGHHRRCNRLSETPWGISSKALASAPFERPFCKSPRCLSRVGVSPSCPGSLYLARTHWQIRAPAESRQPTMQQRQEICKSCTQGHYTGPPRDAVLPVSRLIQASAVLLPPRPFAAAGVSMRPHRTSKDSCRVIMYFPAATVATSLSDFGIVARSRQASARSCSARQRSPLWRKHVPRA